MSKAAVADNLVTGDKKTTKAAAHAKKLKRRRLKIRIVAGLILFLTVLIWYGMQPFKGDANYGICRTFAELRVAYPHTIKILSYENYGGAWKIFYSFIGEYGEQKSNYIDCTFTVNPANGQRELKEVKINRRSIPKEELRRFNLSIPGVLKGKPNLVVPAPLEETDLMGLRTVYED